MQADRIEEEELVVEVHEEHQEEEEQVQDRGAVEAGSTGHRWEESCIARICEYRDDMQSNPGSTIRTVIICAY